MARRIVVVVEAAAITFFWARPLMSLAGPEDSTPAQEHANYERQLAQQVAALILGDMEINVEPFLSNALIPRHR